ncbi:MAG: sulfurtransferase [Betaproteobacteria bacterium]|nr:sulfurtransferase [Betaproteobacteria bacterium]
MKQIRSFELKAWLDDPRREKPVLLDVREPWEFELCRIDGSMLIPMGSVFNRIGELDPARETVVICHHGVRSYHIARLLELNGFTDVINLTGGVDAWATQVDAAMATY